MICQRPVRPLVLADSKGVGESRRHTNQRADWKLAIATGALVTGAIAGSPHQRPVRPLVLADSKGVGESRRFITQSAERGGSSQPAANLQR